LAVDDDTLPLLKWLLDHGANPNIRAFRTPHSCGDEDTPIEYAATRHETTGLQLLLEYGARPDTSAIIKTMSARKFRPYVSHIPHVKLLLDYGADINYVTKELGTPLHCAVEFGEEDMLRYLLERGADASIRDNFGMTPAEKAKSEGQTNCLRILEEYSSG
jgi:ankyrin repeat protein